MKLISSDKLQDPAFIKGFLADGSRRAVIVSSDIYEILFIKEEGNIELTRLEDSIITDHMAFNVRKDSVLIVPFNQKILEFADAGIIDLKSHEKHFYVAPPDDKIVLTLFHLGIGFYIWLSCVAICLIFFLFEVFLKKYLSRSYNSIMRKIKARIEQCLMN